MKLRIEKRDFKQYPHIYVCGDIHGMYEKFMALLDKIPYESDDLFVFLGDYIDRGHDSDVVLDRIMKLEKETNVVALMGNHEYMALDSFRSDADASDRELWFYNGGKETMEAFRMSGRTDKYMAWIGKRPHILSLNDRIFMAHAGINPKRELAEQKVDDVVWIREEFLEGYHGDNTWFVGHTPVQYMISRRRAVPWRRPNKIIMMDTGSYYGDGSISCVELKTRQIYQSN